MSTVILDDRDPSIVYSSGWHAGNVFPEHNSTTMYTDSQGATAKLTFNGISISVYGTLGTNSTNQTAPQTQYQLDANKPVVFQPILTLETQRNQRFYQSPELLQGQHTLTMTNLLNGSSLFILDYFIVSGSTASSSSSPTSPTAVLDAPKNQNTAVIAGSVGGAVAFTFLLVVIYFWRRRRTRKREDDLNSIVQSAWVNPSRENHGPAATLPSRSNEFTLSLSTTPLPSKKTLPSLSVPSTSNHASSTVGSDLPPRYNP